MRNRRVFLSLLLVQALACAANAPLVRVQEMAAPCLEVAGIGSAPLVLAMDDLKKMPRKTMSVVNPHTNKSEVYEGVPVEELLRKVGTPQGENLRGPGLASYVVFAAEDGYQVVFSLAELDSEIMDSGVMVADTINGAALAAKAGPFRLVAPHKKRPAPWVRMLKSITVVRVPTS